MLYKFISKVGIPILVFISIIGIIYFYYSAPRYVLLDGKWIKVPPQRATKLSKVFYVRTNMEYVISRSFILLLITSSFGIWIWNLKKKARVQ